MDEEKRKKLESKRLAREATRRAEEGAVLRVQVLRAQNPTALALYNKLVAREAAALARLHKRVCNSPEYRELMELAPSLCGDIDILHSRGIRSAETLMRNEAVQAVLARKSIPHGSYL